MARVVAVLLGIDHLPGATITRYCSSSVQTTRMAFHAIKAGEGDVFISAGVETVSRFAKGNSDRLPRHPEPALRRRRGAHRRSRAQGGQDWHDPREDGARARRLHRDGPDRRERRPAARPQPRRSSTSSASAVAEPRREGDRRRLLGARDHPGHHARRHRGQRPTTARAPASPSRRSPSSSRCSAPTASVTAGNCCPLNDGAAAVVVMSDTKAARARPHPAGPDRLHRRHRPLPRDHGPRPGRGDQAGAGARRHDASTTSTWSRSTRRSRRRSCRPTRTSASTSTGSTSTAARSRSATRSA